MVLTGSVVSHIWFLVKDLDRAVRFFGDVLGLRLLEARRRAARFDGGNLTIGLFEVDDDRMKSPIITFRVEGGIEKVREYLQRQGVRAEGADMALIGQVLTIEDTEGHLLWVHQPPEEDE